MIGQVIEHINALLVNSLMIEKAYGLCETISQGDKKFPAEYCINKYVEVSDFGKFKGLCYHRIDGAITFTQTEDESNSCDVYTEKKYPLVLIIGVKKDLFKNNNNDSFIELSIIENIEQLISSQNNKTLSNLINADIVSIDISSASYNRYEIFSKEYSKVEMKVPFEYAYISIKYDVIIAQKLSCYTPLSC